MKKWQAIIAIHNRNMKILMRQKQMLIQPIIVPLVLLFLMVVIFGGGGDDWPVAIVDDSNSVESQELMEAFKSSASNITPYFDLIEMNPEEAEKKVSEGRLHLFIKIPDDFVESKSIEMKTYNINSDAMKNVRLRVEHTLNNYMEQQGELQVTSQQVTAQPNDVWRAAFYGGSSVLLTLFLGSMIIAANLHAFEYENRTAKEIILTPTGSIMAGFGIIITSVLVSLILSLIPLTLSILFLHFEFHLYNIVLVYLSIIPILIGCAGIGLLLGAYFKQYRVLQPLVILIGIGTYIIGGGFAGVNMLMPLAREIADIWVFSVIFEWFNPVLHNFASSFSFSQYTFIFLAGILGFLFTFIAYWFGTRKSIFGGQ
ncbi:ABC transporter permease [Saliterribacillus persicus]|uniref:ABC-type Na+ efflux pump permease subunit n=1 Tax=Saliterribacillus persicus TaxID=930114 RepID=A0A368XZ38_9BACI|nr:ABC transporter permease [Saliterribacillus persicus]RCW73271.1 ABC-type Na+ efflux pump permease subunit [Saliterribacillus persicus]